MRNDKSQIAAGAGDNDKSQIAGAGDNDKSQIAGVGDNDKSQIAGAGDNAGFKMLLSRNCGHSEISINQIILLVGTPLYSASSSLSTILYHLTPSYILCILVDFAVPPHPKVTAFVMLLLVFFMSAMCMTHTKNKISRK